MEGSLLPGATLAPRDFPVPDPDVLLSMMNSILRYLETAENRRMLKSQAGELLRAEMPELYQKGFLRAVIEELVKTGKVLSHEISIQLVPRPENTQYYIMSNNRESMMMDAGSPPLMDIKLDHMVNAIVDYLEREVGNGGTIRSTEIGQTLIKILGKDRYQKGYARSVINALRDKGMIHEYLEGTTMWITYRSYKPAAQGMMGGNYVRAVKSGMNMGLLGMLDGGQPRPYMATAFPPTLKAIRAKMELPPQWPPQASPYVTPDMGMRNPVPTVDNIELEQMVRTILDYLEQEVGRGASIRSTNIGKKLIESFGKERYQKGYARSVINALKDRGLIEEYLEGTTMWITYKLPSTGPRSTDLNFRNSVRPGATGIMHDDTAHAFGYGPFAPSLDSSNFGGAFFDSQGPYWPQKIGYQVGKLDEQGRESVTTEQIDIAMDYLNNEVGNLGRIRHGKLLDVLGASAEIVYPNAVIEAIKERGVINEHFDGYNRWLTYNSSKSVRRCGKLLVEGSYLISLLPKEVISSSSAIAEVIRGLEEEFEADFHEKIIFQGTDDGKPSPFHRLLSDSSQNGSNFKLEISPLITQRVRLADASGNSTSVRIEKGVDVSLAVEIVGSASEDKTDIVVVISADVSLAAALLKARELQKKKSMGSNSTEFFVCGSHNMPEELQDFMNEVGQNEARRTVYLDDLVIATVMQRDRLLGTLSMIGPSLDDVSTLNNKIKGPRPRCNFLDKEGVCTFVSDTQDSMHHYDEFEHPCMEGAKCALFVNFAEHKDDPAVKQHFRMRTHPCPFNHKCTSICNPAHLRKFTHCFDWDDETLLSGFNYSTVDEGLLSISGSKLPENAADDIDVKTFEKQVQAVNLLDQLVFDDETSISDEEGMNEVSGGSVESLEGHNIEVNMTKGEDLSFSLDKKWRDGYDKKIIKDTYNTHLDSLLSEVSFGCFKNFGL